MLGASQAEKIIQKRQMTDARVSLCGAFAMASLMGYAAWNVSDTMHKQRASKINQMIAQVSQYNQPTPSSAQLQSAHAAYREIAASPLKSVSDCLNMAGAVAGEGVLKSTTTVVNTKILTSCLENVPERNPQSDLIGQLQLVTLFGSLAFGATLALGSGKSLFRRGKIPQTPTHTAR